MTWKQICADPVVAALPYKVESDQWGNIVMSPPPGFNHSKNQSRILILLSRLLPGGDAMAEFPLRTSKGVKGLDVIWISHERLAQQQAEDDVALIAPEICIEVISPANKRGEIAEKMSLYFERGATECWTCDRKGKMDFYDVTGPIPRSRLCPKFPRTLAAEKSGR